MAIAPGTRSSYLQYLPAIFADEPFLGRYLLAYEQVLTGLRQTGEPTAPEQGLAEVVAELARYFDPKQTPEEFLPWLARWVALTLRADWATDQQRQFLARIVPLYRRRGTKENLAELVSIYTGLAPIISDGEDVEFQIGRNSQIGVSTRVGGSAPHYFRVEVTLAKPPTPDALQRQRQIIAALVELEKPAHTTYDLAIQFGSMQIGVRSTIGVDTLLGTMT